MEDQHALRCEHEFEPPLVVPYPLGTGFVTALLRVTEIAEGPPFGREPRDGIWIPANRKLRVQFEILRPKTPPVRPLNATILTRIGHSFEWPEIGREFPVMLRTKRVRLDGAEGCQILKMQRGELLGS